MHSLEALFHSLEAGLGTLGDPLLDGRERSDAVEPGLQLGVVGKRLLGKLGKERVRHDRAHNVKQSKVRVGGMGLLQQKWSTLHQLGKVGEPEKPVRATLGQRMETPLTSEK